jgi:hypothetical protein
MDGNVLIAGFLVSTIGFGFFMYGKKQSRAPQLVTGIALMVYPYFVWNVAWVLAIAPVLVGLMWLGIRMGL